jgi:hypothetical protein
MTIKQLSIFLENKVGHLAMVTETLAGAGINIHALSLADTSDFGILRLIVSDAENAMRILKKAGFTVNITMVIAAEMPHKPGGLHGILHIFKAEGLNIEYMYAFVQNSQAAAMVFRCKEEEKAVAALLKNQVRILSESALTDA